jgi:DNA invertase Pin-like site-specific DNA recombinase
LTTIGYARVSTVDQDLTIPFDALKAAGCDVIRQEKASGTSTEGRAELKTVLDFLAPWCEQLLPPLSPWSRNSQHRSD